MKNVLAVAGFTSLAALGLFRQPSTPRRASTQVQVRCPAGDTVASVNPDPVHIALGDTIEWRATGRVVADSLSIALKGQGNWPFTGAMPSGASNARSGAARTRGTFSYAVRLTCRVAGGTRTFVIDPDIIIE